jgi:hypothetical protein
MNFLTEPPHIISLNSAMTLEQEDVAEAFLQELVGLGVFLEVDADFVVVNAPMFCLPKLGQPGEWRILADMKRGGQNACVGADPTVFPRSLFILDQMYNGGWSWVVDMSKYFYNFPTHPAERRYLGVFSTTTGKAYVYCGLAMGAGNSPSIAGRHGAAFMRKLQETCPLYQGIPKLNTWWKAFA